MRTSFPARLLLAGALCFGTLILQAQGADVLTPGFLKVSLYTSLPGPAVADFTADAKYPSSPDEIRFLHSLNTRDALPSDVLQDFGGRIEGFLTPLESGDYHFFLRSDANSQLWLGTDDTETSAVMIAEETDRGDPFLEPDTGDPATSLPITLTAGKRYFIMVLYKGNGGDGNGADYAQVAWRKTTDTTPAVKLKPISGAFLSTLASPANAPKIAVAQQPKDISGEENTRVTLAITPDVASTNFVSVQWQRNGVNIPGATGTNYTRFLDKSDHGAKFRAVISVPGAFLNSGEATATVTDDKTTPTLVSAKGGPNRPEVLLTFSERLNRASATTAANYKITAPGGAALAVTEAALAGDGTQVTLKTDAQTVGTTYTVTVSNVADLAAAGPKAITAGNQTTFVAVGPLLQGDDGFVVWEAEDYDRNLDGLWFASPDRGVASGGLSMVNYNGAGGSEANTRLEYDIYFPTPGMNIVWWRFSGNDGNDDSAWFYVDGARPVGRETGNFAALSGTGSSLAGNWGWTANPFEGGGQMTFVIDKPGVHSIGLARREDGAFADKFVITKDPNFNPTTVFGPLGPPVTLRQGEPLPPGASAEITLQPANSTGVENSSLTLTAGATVPAGVLFTFQWQRKQGANFADLPGATLTNLVINPLTADWNGAVVRMRVIAGGVSKYSAEATITVTQETTAPQLVRAVGLAASSRVTIAFSEPVTRASAEAVSNYKINAAGGGALAITSATLSPGGRMVVLATGPQTVGTKYTITVNGVADTAAKPNLIANAQTKFYSLGDLAPQGADGLLVFEAEAYARNLDGLWIEDKARGNPSGGFSVVVPNGSSDSEAATQLEYDLTFTKTGTNIVWYRASSDNGSDDSAWLWLDGARPANRATANQASMSGFSTQPDFVWRSNPQDGGGQMTIIIGTAGPHTVHLEVVGDFAEFNRRWSCELVVSEGKETPMGRRTDRCPSVPEEVEVVVFRQHAQLEQV